MQGSQQTAQIFCIVMWSLDMIYSSKSMVTFMGPSCVAHSIGQFA